MNIDDIITKKAENEDEGINGYVTNFAHGGLRKGEMFALDSLIDKVKRQNICLVDIGVAKGSSSAVMAFRAKELNGIVYSIDDYAPHPHFIEIFKSNMKYLGLYKYIKLIIERSEVVYTKFQDETVDLVFIDASHLYSNVVRDINCWFPKVRKGGIICGHDCQVLSKDGKVNIKDKIIDIRQYQNVARETVGYDGQDILVNGKEISLHTGVILAVGDTFPDAQVIEHIWWKQK